MSCLWSHPFRKSLNCCLSHSSYFLTCDIHCANQKKKKKEQRGSYSFNKRVMCLTGLLDEWQAARWELGFRDHRHTSPPHHVIHVHVLQSLGHETCHSLPWSLTNMCLCIYIFMSVYIYTHPYVLGSAISIQCLSIAFHIMFG